MTDPSAFQALLTQQGLAAFDGFVPEGAAKPAVAWVHITGIPVRSLQGNQSGWSDSWRLTVVANDETERAATIAKLRSIDNTASIPFKRITVTSQRLDNNTVGEPLWRAFLDLTTIS